MLTASLPGIQPEVFDNITGETAAFWIALAAAVNTGAGVQRSASRLITIQPNGNTSTPTNFSITSDCVAGNGWSRWCNVHPTGWAGWHHSDRNCMPSGDRDAAL